MKRHFAVLAAALLVCTTLVTACAGSRDEAGEQPSQAAERIDRPADADAGAPPPLRAMALEDEGDFELSYTRPDDAALTALAEQIRDAEVLEPEIDWLNESFALPQDIAVTWLECGEDNAFYDPETKTVELCYEMVADFQARFEADGDDPEDAFWYAMDTTAFYFHHEVGHAFVDLYDLPITGREEDAVDELAAITLIEGWEDGALSLMAAIDSFYLTGMEEEASGEAEDLPFWDEHAFDLQRFYSIACLIYGSDPEAEGWLIEDGSVPEERAEMCIEEYAQKRDSWGWLLDPYYLPAPAEDA